MLLLLRRLHLISNSVDAVLKMLRLLNGLFQACSTVVVGLILAIFLCVWIAGTLVLAIGQVTATLVLLLVVSFELL